MKTSHFKNTRRDYVQYMYIVDAHIMFNFKRNQFIKNIIPSILFFDKEKILFIKSKQYQRYSYNNSS